MARSSECTGVVRFKSAWHRRHCQRSDFSPIDSRDAYHTDGSPSAAV